MRGMSYEEMAQELDKAFDGCPNLPEELSLIVSELLRYCHERGGDPYEVIDKAEETYGLVRSTRASM